MKLTLYGKSKGLLVQVSQCFGYGLQTKIPCLAILSPNKCYIDHTYGLYFISQSKY